MRYWYHPESDCLFTTQTDEEAEKVLTQGDGLVEEIDYEKYKELSLFRNGRFVGDWVD